MQLIVFAVGIVVLGQASSGQSPATGQASSRSQSTPPDILATALSLPPGSAIAGQPVPLLSALSSAADQRQQLEIVHSYWNLVEAVAVYHFCWDYEKQLQQLPAQPDEEIVLRPARASVLALRQEAEVAVVAAQHNLAALMRLPPEAALPLPADRPHVGQYRTAFSELFPAGNGPAQARLLDRLLPLRQRAIDSRLAAIQAADEALKATTDARVTGRAGLVDVLRCAGECLKQRQAWMVSVSRYNHDIADYAVAVIRPGASPQVLLGMLIKPIYEPVPPLGSPMDNGVRPTGLTEPVPTPTPRSGKLHPTPAKRPSPTAPPEGNEPTLTPPPQQLPPLMKNEPTLAPREPQSQPAAADKNQPTASPAPSGSLQPAKKEPTLAPAEEQREQPPTGEREPTLAPPEGSTSAGKL